MTEPAAEPGLPSPAPEPPLSIDEHGIGWLSLPPPAPPEGTGPELLEWLDGALARVEPALAEGLVRALVVQGAEPGAFLRDEPLGEPGAAVDAEQATAAVRRAQQVLRRLELLRVPTVAAVDGACLGAGTALALACAYRVASDRPATRIGFPEVRLGLIPGPGSSVRLPRLVGLRAALDLVLGGRAVPAREARRIGLVDEVYPPRDFAERVRGFVLERLERGRRRSGARRPIARRLLEETAPGRRVLLARASRELLPRLAFAAPAPERVLALIGEGPLLPLDEAFRREAEVLGALVVGERSRALRYASRAARSASRAAPTAPEPLERVGVLGAGATGSDLAYLLASAGVPVRLKEVRREALGEGIRRALRHLALDVAAGRITEAEADRSAERIEGSLGYGGFGTLDLAVAAVGEKADAVRDALRHAGDHTREGCVLAFASPVLRLAEVHEGLERERVVALRLCAPADRFPVAEVVADDEAAAARCVELLQRMGRTTLRVADGPGGVANRLLAVLLAEAGRLAQDGTPPAQVDRALEEFGFVLGPFRRVDAMGVQRCQRLLHSLAAELGDRFRPAPALLPTGEGEPAAAPDGEPAPSTGAAGDWPTRAESIRHRLLLLLINEAALILDEGVVGTPAEIEVAALLGLGFPRARGGLLYHADQLGVARVVDLLQEHEERLGERFAPAPLLLRLRDHPAGLSGHAPAGVL